MIPVFAEYGMDGSYALNPKPPFVTVISVIPPLVVDPTYAIAPTGFAESSLKPPTIVTGSPG